MLANGEPRCLRLLHRAAEASKVFGFQNRLLPTPSSPADVIDVIVENQVVWTIGYLPMAPTSLTRSIYGYDVDDVYAILDRGLPQVVYQAAFIEAVFSHPNLSVGVDVDTDAAAEVLGPHLVASELTDGGDFSLPSTWDLGDILVTGFGDEWFFACARELSVLQHSKLAAIGQWR